MVFFGGGREAVRVFGAGGASFLAGTDRVEGPGDEGGLGFASGDEGGGSGSLEADETTDLAPVDGDL